MVTRYSNGNVRSPVSSHSRNSSEASVVSVADAASMVASPCSGGSGPDRRRALSAQRQAMPMIHVDARESPRNCAAFCQTIQKVSLIASSIASRLPVSRDRNYPSLP